MRLPIVALPLLLAACTSGDAAFQRATVVIPYAPWVPQADAAVNLADCDGLGLVRYVGHPVIAPSAPIPPEGAYVTWDDLPPTARILGPGTTGGDRVGDRLTLTVDEDGRLHRLYCG